MAVACGFWLVVCGFSLRMLLGAGGLFLWLVAFAVTFGLCFFLSIFRCSYVSLLSYGTAWYAQSPKMRM